MPHYLPKQKPLCRKPRGGGDGGIGAFTIVELLVVIGLIATLAVLLAVASGRVREASQSARCVHQLRQVGGALMTFAGDHNQTIFLGIEKFGAGSSVQWLRYLIGLTDGEHNRGTKGAIYLMDPSAAICPSFRPFTYVPKPSDNVGYTYGAASRDASDPYSKPLPEGKASTRVIRLSTMATPAAYWLLTDSFQATNKKQIYTIGATDQTRSVHFRHGGRANTLFADGHVESLTLKEFSQLPYYARNFGYDEKENLIQYP